MTEAPDLVPSRPGAKKGSKGKAVAQLQQYLAKFGYIESEVLGQFGVRRVEQEVDVEQPPAEMGEFDDSTEHALCEFQRFNNLEVTGKLNSETLALMKQPRCGFPDTAQFVVQGNKWNTNDLRYGFDGFTGDLTQAQIRGEIEKAFDLWAAVTPLTFNEVAPAQNAEIRINFVTGSHGDGSPFDGPSGVLAHAYYPPPNGGDIAGDTHFDDAENWTIGGAGTDLCTVAAHEFGHALGLAHSTVQGSLMYPYYGGPACALTQDDIDGIQQIYGAPPTAGWQNNKTVLRCYTSQSSKNAWAFLDGLGWRKVKPDNADAVTAMFAALCGARTSGQTVNAFIDADQITQVTL